ncbi:exonuclease 1 [Conger conger]|uniref:exonuclease 1 n=1 Tax=Conger conger TaxID=82655 RepID=UPI002A59C0D4|nr:exonuclease 1 [Conger conger]XP_061084541.1 exonuclease 1 [Conger conger]XP_061084543.1 exonuclease 1 [Conger conger]
MGIQGLLQFIKDASEAISVKKYKGQTVAVDTYCWLHKGAFSCAEKLAKGEPTDQYVTYCMKFVDMLLSFGVKPILVFDGCNLPSKKEVDTARRERRQANLQKGKQLLREGKISEARDCFTRCINVTPAMAREVIKAARRRGVDCVVAPYEADAQLAFLNKTGIAQAVITEDSDLLAFGCKKVILKMDKHGNGLEIDQSNLGRCRALGDVFTEEKFRYMCILSGCDYLASLYGIGLGKACKLLKVASNPDILKVIRKMGQYLKMNVTVPDEYIEGFVKANNTFLYQLVFDPLRRKVVPLNPYADDIDPSSLSYAGRNVGDVKGLQMALGNMDINTMQKIDDYNPDTAQPAKPRSRSWNDSKENRSLPGSSIWRKGYSAGGPSPSLPPMCGSPERPTTKGKQRVVHLQGLRLPHRELPVKRPREAFECDSADPGVSEEDILEQYSSCGLKKPRREGSQPATGVRAPPVERPPVAAPQPRARNRFATLLQRRNQDDECEDGQVTQSRFFCSVGSSVGSSQGASPEPQGPGAGDSDEDGAGGSDGRCQPGERLQAGEEPETEATVGALEARCQRGGTPSPPSSQSPRGVFSWSGSSTGTPTPTSGLSALQRFQRKKDSFSWSAPCPTPSPPHREDEEQTPLDPSPSQDSAYFSQPGHTSPGALAPSLTPSQAHHRDSPIELDMSQESNCSENTSCSPVLERKPSVIRAKVSGLSRVRSADLGKRGKIQPSAPARASGLRKTSAKPTGPGKRPGPDSENTPGLQATISSLWKNFGFQKERPKMNSGKKGEPMSPVKDNLPLPTPESTKDIYFTSESTSYQKTICL